MAENEKRKKERL